jgi:hypothetical protein
VSKYLMLLETSLERIKKRTGGQSHMPDALTHTAESLNPHPSCAEPAHWFSGDRWMMENRNGHGGGAF